MDLCGLVGSAAREGYREGETKRAELGAIDQSFSNGCVPCWCGCCGTRLINPNNCLDVYVKCLWCECALFKPPELLSAGIS